MDFKLAGYSISAVSVLLLGVVAWPQPGEPEWKRWAVLLGMTTSIAGMFLRYLAHRKDQRNIRRAANDKPPRP